MPTNECRPFFKPGQDITGRLTTNIGGKLFVAPVPGGRGGQPWIGVCGAGAAACGVMGHDGVAGDFIHFNVGGTVPVEAGVDIIAGTRVMSNATGQAVPYDPATPANVPLGLATSNAAAGGAVSVQLNLG